MQVTVPLNSSGTMNQGLDVPWELLMGMFDFLHFRLALVFFLSLMKKKQTP